MTTMPLVCGHNFLVRVANGRAVRPVLLNGAATTPPFLETMDAVERFMLSYSTYGRGAGLRAEKTAEIVDLSIQIVRAFFGLGSEHALIFRGNTSEAINLLVRLLRLTPADVVFLAESEHTSNALPWLQTRSVVDLGLATSKLLPIQSRRIIPVAGAHNLSGSVTDLATVAQLAREHDAFLVVDAAQLAPHRPINLTNQCIDALALSGHKLYAPFGIGLLALPVSLLDRPPVDPGGGAVDMISDDSSVVWAPPNERHQVGTWNTTGIVALAASCQVMARVGWDQIVKHERTLRRAALAGLTSIPGLTLHVPPDRYETEDRIPTFPFSLAGIDHAEVARRLGQEHGIELRSGTICNHRLVRRWLNVSDVEQAATVARLTSGERTTYGVVRASFGLHNSLNDVDRLTEALRAITACL